MYRIEEVNVKNIERILRQLSRWYERHYTLNVGIAAFLFIWQLVHLYWLTTDVVFLKLFGTSFFNPEKLWEYVLIVVDYTEIPAIIITSFIYIHSLSQKFSWKSIWFLIFLNSQWLHLFWITDEFVIEQFTGSATTILPIWLAWVAIFIDYLELPVIYDTFKKFFVSLGRK